MGALTRRAFLRLVVPAGAALAAACSPATAPIGSQGTPDTASPVPPLTPPTQGTFPTPSVAPFHAEAWVREWESVIGAAKREGTVSLITWGDGGYREAIEDFEQAFPGITVNRLAESSARVWLGHVRQKRRSGNYSFDLALVQPDWALKEGAPEGMWAPLKPLLFRPDVLDDRVWRDGLNYRYLDIGGSLCFDWEYQVQHAYAVNTDLVAEGEIGAFRDLLDPKWRGKILTSDPRLGSGLLSAASVARSCGIDVVRQLLLDQRPIISRGGSHLAEAVVQGRYPIVMGLRPKALQPFMDQGLASKVAYLDLPEADSVASTALLYFTQAPHPAAAKLFANWILTEEGQTALTRGIRTNSARTDVTPFEPYAVGAAGQTYFDPDREANYKHVAETQKFVNGLLGTPSR